MGNYVERHLLGGIMSSVQEINVQNLVCKFKR